MKKFKPQRRTKSLQEAQRRRRLREARKMQAEIDPAIRLAMATQPLLELFSVADDVFFEDDAFDEERMRAGYGRLYRQWKKSREAMDPDFDRHRGHPRGYRR